MTVTEPMTVATDYLLGLLTVLLGGSLLRQGHSRRCQAVLLWGRGFLATGLAAWAGGTFHGFREVLGPVGQVFLWKGTAFAVGFAGFFLLAGALWDSVSGRARRWLISAALAKLLIYMAWMSVHDDFRFVIYDYAPVLAILLGLQAWNWKRSRSPAAPWIAGGVLVSVLAAVIQAAHLAPHPQFNHNDLYHVVQMGAFVLLYKGGRRLQDR